MAPYDPHDVALLAGKRIGPDATHRVRRATAIDEAFATFVGRGLNSLMSASTEGVGEEEERKTGLDWALVHHAGKVCAQG